MPVKLQHFDLNLLKVLSVLYEERSVTRAADRLGRTQSAVSNSLRNLRDALDDPLFVRGADGLTPTPKARTLEEQVNHIIRSTDRFLTDDAAFDPAAASGRCRLGAPDRMSLPVVVPLLQSITAAAPGLNVDVITTDRDQALQMLDDDRIDLAIGWFDSPPGRFKAELLFHEVFVCLCRPEHPILSKKASAELADILAYPHLVVSAAGDHKAAFDTLLARRGLERDARRSVSGFSIVPNILRENDLIGVFTARVAQALARDFGLATLPVPMEIEPLDHFMVWHSRDDADQQHTWIRDQIKLACDV